GEALPQLVLDERAGCPLDPQRVEERCGRMPVERRALRERVEWVERPRERADAPPEAVHAFSRRPREHARFRAPPLTEVDDAVQVRVRLCPHVLEPEPEPLRVEAHEPVTGVDELAPSFGVLPGGDALAHGVTAPAWAVARLGDDDAAPRLLELGGADEAGEAGADDDDVDRRRRSEGASGAKRDRGAGGSGQQLSPGETRRQGRSSY